MASPGASFIPRAAPHPHPLPAANPRPPAGRGDLRVAPLTRTVQAALHESPLPAGGVGVGGGERVRVRGGSRGPSYSATFGDSVVSEVVAAFSGSYEKLSGSSRL